MTEHSPGPWTACQGGKCRCGFIWAADGEVNVAAVFGPSALGQNCYGSDTCCNSETQEANARLIAAAPDMLAALEACIKGSRDWMEQAKAAIAKVHGRD